MAVYKQVVKFDPEDVRVNEWLAALYQQLGLMSDAMGQHQLMAQGYEKAGDQAKLLEVLRRMVELDPENVASSIKLGELYQRGGQAAPALEHLRRAADYLKKHNRADEYLKVAERIATLVPDDLALTRELANLYLSRGDTKRALSKLQVCFAKDRKDVETLTLLAQAFRELGQTSKQLQVYKELARVHEERGRPAEAKATWRKVLELAPGDPEAVQALPQAPAAPPAPAVQAPRPPPAGPPPGAAAARPAAPAAPPAPSPDQVPKLLTEADVYLKYGLLEKAHEHLRRVLAIDPGCLEALERLRELHASAGRPAEAASAGEAAVRAALERQLPERAKEALARLRDLAPTHGTIGELGEAVGNTTEISLQHEDVEELVEEPGPPEAGPVDEPVFELEPPPAELEAPTELLPEAIEPFPSLDPVPVLPPEPEPEPVLEALPEPAFEPPPEVLSEVELADEAPTVADDQALALAVAGEGPLGLEDEPVGSPAPLEVTAEAELPLEPAAPSPDDELAAGAAAVADAPEEIVDEPLEGPPPPPVMVAPEEEPAAAAAEAEAAAEDDEVDLADELEEVDFFVQQGLLDEAHESLANLVAFYPEHRGVRERVALVEQRRAAAVASQPPPQAEPPLAAAEPPRAEAPPPQPAPAGPLPASGLGSYRESPQLVDPSAAGGASFDIGQELKDELEGLGEGGPLPADDDAQYSVEDVFNLFKKGVAETVKAEDSETHYDLGIAYKEMGLLEDAVHEFETALKGTNRRKEVECLSMVGLCRMMQGRPRDAVEALRRALRSDYLGKESVKAVHFELGEAHEALGEPEVALWYLQKVARLDGAYRQVGQRIAALGGGPGRPPAEEGPPPAPARGAPPRPAATPPGAAGPKKNIGYL